MDVALLSNFTLANSFFGDFWPEFVDQGRVQGIAVDNCGELVNVLVLHVQAAVFAKVGVPLALHQRTRLFTPKIVPECFFLPESMSRTRNLSPQILKQQQASDIDVQSHLLW